MSEPKENKPKTNMPRFNLSWLYIIIAMGLSVLSMVFKFSGKSEMDEANSNTFEKLD